MTTIAAPTDLAASPPVGGKNFPVRSVDNGPMAAYLDRSKFEQVFSVASMLAKSDLVPGHFKGKPENCFIAVQLASRMNMDPFAVMQACYIVSGKPGFEAKFVIALVNSSGLFSGPLSFAFSGTPGKPDWTCTCSGVRRDNGETVSLDFRYQVAIDEGWVAKGGSKWKTMPEQMMRYRAAAFFARVYCPEVIMGVQTNDELEDVGGVEVITPAPMKRPQVKQIESNVMPAAQAAPIDPPAPDPDAAPLMQDVITIVESLAGSVYHPSIYRGLGLDPKCPPMQPVSADVLRFAQALKATATGDMKPSSADGWKSAIETVKAEIAKS